MSRRDYTQRDYAVCRYILENATVGLRAPINDAGTALTIADVLRLRLLRLADGPVGVAVDGELVRMAGLGQKTASEAIRLGIAASS